MNMLVALRTALPTAALVALFAGASLAQDLRWERHADPVHGHRYEIPAAMFERAESEPGKLIFDERAGPSRIVMYSGDIPDGMPMAEFEAGVRAAEWIRDVTYRTGGDSWFVLSGHYEPGVDDEEPVIFYTKFMVSRDRSRYSALEVTYPKSRKSEFDPIVTRLEKSLRAPS